MKVFCLTFSHVYCLFLLLYACSFPSHPPSSIRNMPPPPLHRPSRRSFALVAAALGVLLLAAWPALSEPRSNGPAVDVLPEVIQAQVRVLSENTILLVALCVLAHVLHGAVRQVSAATAFILSAQLALCCCRYLTALLFAVVVASLLQPSFSSALCHASSAFVAWMSGIALSFLLFICLGAPVTLSSSTPGQVSFGFSERLALALLLSALVVLPPAQRAGFNARKWQQIFFLSAPLAAGDEVALPSLVSLVTCCVASVLLPLDAGTRWQVFPLCNLVGAAVGFLVGEVMQTANGLMHREHWAAA
jgi:hypothetical protein